LSFCHDDDDDDDDDGTLLLYRCTIFLPRSINIEGNKKQWKTDKLYRYLREKDYFYQLAR
jgi:hypothetical protein